MKHLLILAFSFVALDLSSQISGVVTDRSSGYPIQYANVRIENGNAATVTDDKGIFVLGTNYTNKTLIISAIGFIPARIAADSGFMKIEMETDVYKVAEAVIAGERIREELIVDNYSVDSVSIWHCFSAERQVAAKYFGHKSVFNVPPQIRRLVILINNPAPRASIQVSLLNSRRNGKPGDEMIESKLTRTIIKGKQNIAFNLEGFHITYPPDGFFAVVEWTENRHDYEPCIGITGTSGTKGYWIDSGGKWKRVRGSEKAGNPGSVDLAIKLILSDRTIYND